MVEEDRTPGVPRCGGLCPLGQALTQHSHAAPCVPASRARQHLPFPLLHPCPQSLGQTHQHRKSRRFCAAPAHPPEASRGTLRCPFSLRGSPAGHRLPPSRCRGRRRRSAAPLSPKPCDGAGSGARRKAPHLLCAGSWSFNPAPSGGKKQKKTTGEAARQPAERAGGRGSKGLWKNFAYLIGLRSESGQPVIKSLRGLAF